MKPGDRYGRWVVIGPPPATAHTRVQCRCDCGTVREVVADTLHRGTSQSCGCLRREVGQTRRRPPAERFWERVNKDGPIPERRPELGPCWIWTGSLDEKGYGRFNDGCRARKAHDYAYELASGPMPPGLEPDHLCRNRPCVRRAHLEAVTHQENCRRAAEAQEVCSEGHTLPEPGENGRRVCQTCANRRNRTYKQRLRANRPTPPPCPVIHGRSRYTHHGCRCEICCSAENEYKRKWRQDQKALPIYDAVMGGPR